MSELTKTLKSAIVSLTEAKNYIQDSGDFLGNYADDVELELFEKRQKLSAREKEAQELSSDDESTAVFAFANLLPDGYLVMLYSLFDECLFSVTLEISRLQGKELNYDRGQTGRFTADQAIQFLTDEVGVEIAARCPSWEKINNIRKLRNIVLTDYRYVRDEHVPYLQSLAQSSKHFSYEVLFDIYKTFDFGFDFLAELSETMILFFQELQKPLSDIAGSQA